MDFSKYLIVTDLDGTFVHQGKVVPKNIEAVRRFAAGGGVFTLATGRIFETVPRALPQPQGILNAPAILCNGAYLYDFEKKQTFAESFIPAKTAADVVNFIKAHCPEVPLRVSTPRGIRLDTPRGRVIEDLALYSEARIEIAPMAAWRLNDWYKLVLRDEPEALARVRTLFEEHLSGKGLICCFSGKHFLEIQPDFCNKGEGLRKLLALAPYRDRTVIACGDFENDIELLQAADIAVCPANAMESVKAIADYTLCDCSEGLIAEVISMIEARKI